MMFVIDIEGRGKSVSRNGIVSIGVCIGLKNGGLFPEVIEKRRFDLLPLPGQVMDPVCKSEFWDAQPNGLLETLQANAVDPIQGITEFRTYLDAWNNRDPELYILCDNPAYDFAFIDHYLDVAGLLPLAYNTLGKFRALHDADSYTRGMFAQRPNSPWTNNKEIIERLALKIGLTSLVAHSPEDDAEGIYRFHYALVFSVKVNSE